MAAVKSARKSFFNRLAIATVLIATLSFLGTDLLDRLDGIQAEGAGRHRAADGVLRARDHAIHPPVHQARAAAEAGRPGRLRRRALVGEAHLRRRRAGAEGRQRRSALAVSGPLLEQP